MRGNLERRFWTKVEVRAADACWLWRGGTDRYGYGKFSVAGQSTVAHRVAYELIVGEIPKPLHALHHCDVRNCVNPAHLFLGTNDDNVADRIAKGRGKVVRPPRLRDPELCKPRRVTIRPVSADERASAATTSVRRQTHCKRGHEFTTENTHFSKSKDGYIGRNCRACQKIRERARKTFSSAPNAPELGSENGGGSGVIGAAASDSRVSLQGGAV